MKDPVRFDLNSLWDNNFVLRARELNEQLDGNYFHENTVPKHFTGNPDARTVLVMLNPGYHNLDFDFFKASKYRFNTFDQFMLEYIEGNRNYGENDKDRSDNFDQKQAAFLYDFDDPDLRIPREFWKSTDLKLEAKRNILMNKYQLELIPFCSRNFKGILDTPAQAKSNFIAFEPFLTAVLNEIFKKERKYIVFCSKQFLNLFSAAITNDLWKNIFSFSSPKGFKDGKLTLNCSKVRINYQGIRIDAIIANSFPSQALPNAYEKMMRYGTFCYNELYS